MSTTLVRTSKMEQKNKTPIKLTNHSFLFNNSMLCFDNQIVKLHCAQLHFIGINREKPKIIDTTL